MLGIRRDVLQEGVKPFDVLRGIRPEFLKKKGLPQRLITVKDAIGDLEIQSQGLIHHSGSEVSGFKEINYSVPEKLNSYQKVMRKGLNGAAPNSLRVARHRPSTVEKFKLIQEICRPGLALNEEEKAVIGTRKQAITVLHPDKPSKTLTTLPDDLLHYSEPRILTVRENARIQSFPDSFDFTGKYTTGGERRKMECPRYTQVGNAVPPLLGEIFGLLLKEVK